MSDYEVGWLKGKERIAQAAGVTARALRDNPSSMAVSDDPLVRLDMMYSTFADMLAGARVAGVRRGNCVLGAAGAVQPGHCIASMLPPAMRTLDVPGSDATDAQRFLHMGSLLAAYDLAASHWHVGPVGVEPGFQGMGIGGAAMRLLCAEFDQHHRLAWLETDKPENVRFYIGHGFEVVEEIPMFSERNWFMRRDPRYESWIGTPMERPMIVPMPAVAEDCALPWDAPLTDPVLALADARRLLGDTFVVDSGADRYLFTFAPVGVASFYALPEEKASKGVADWRMLRRKLPDEVFVGRRTLPHQLFGREDVSRLLANVDQALDDTIEELGDIGTTDVFGLTRRLGHRVGLASWGGPGAATGTRFEALVAAFDTLDGSEAFVHPDVMAAVAASGKAAEVDALSAIAEHLGPSLVELPGNEAGNPLFARLVAAWADEPAPAAARGVAGDVTLIHIASMSNLFAALGWALVDLLAHPPEASRVAAGDRATAEVCALESIRVAQRSIMARYAMAPFSFDVGDAVFEVSPGTTVATLLPLTNMSSAPDLATWEPTRWKGRRLADSSNLAAVELVTAFGHGRHTCPAQPFSLAAMTTTLIRLLSNYRWTPGWTDRPLPVRAQIGGVARAGDGCPLTYRRVEESVRRPG